MSTLRRITSRTVGSEVASTILYIGERSGQTHCTATALIDSGFRVDFVPDGESALAALETGRCDLVVASHAPPRVNAFDMVDRLRSAGFTIPIVITCEPAGEPVEERLRERNAAAVLQEPITPKSLLECVRAALPSESTEPSAPVQSAGALARPQAFPRWGINE